ncbi:MAG: ATP-dependent RecD-like DNA helicase [Clostridiales bacterium]|nr:ATP-dependent RecD-like DNA helicase [Clostridiales bacterium]
MGERVTVEGSVDAVIFQNEENGYTVLLLRVDGEDEPITVVGCIPCAAAGEGMTVTGVWVNHPVHGPQLSAESVERRLPQEEEDIVSYLSSGILKGIGPATAQRLVERFGTDTLRVLEEEPERLKTIKGITAKKAVELSEAFRALTGLRQVMEFLARYDLPVYLAMAVQRTYGDNALQMLRDDPYILSRAQFGVDFAVADAIAISMGFGGDDPCRLRAAIEYELAHNAGNGHVFLPREKLLAATAQLVDVDTDMVETALDKLIDSFAVVEKPIANVRGCYLPRMYQAETFVAQRLLSMLRTPVEQLRQVDKTIDAIEKEQGVSYAPLQRQAVRMAAEGGVLLLTGGPGTGKTTSLRGIVALYRRMGLDVALLAPTGRAAKRLGEVTDCDAQTIHRALGMSYNEMTGQVAFKKNGSDPLEAHAVIVDEMSMVDLELMQALLEALRPGCRLVLVGDPDQLPSVGAGNVLGDLLRSTVVPTVSLTQVFRQAEQSAIIRNAHAVNLGQPPQLDSNQGDFFFLCRRSPDRLVQTVVELCRDRLPKNMNVPADQIQVLSPTRKGACGTAALNRALQAALNPPAAGKRQKQWGDVTFRVGDRVMQTKNNYDVLWEKDDGTAGSGIFNGDVGVIQDIDSSGELIVLRFDDRTATYTADLLSQLDMAYAITVHKSQGSEYPAVILVSAPAAPSLMVRGVLYTAITRARRMLIMVGDDTVPAKMAANDRQQRRYSGLRRRLKEGMI